ncbi:hypothetical protein FIBSPDRAFT_965987 [Athelia psychrophila]|uniref:Ribonuclease H1 N-terminal domain-containing protein n=1 Tax=Athelia psychrophila TaxID=1759441 RepID=A0A167XAH6_9AGAM|nr:hypothetical protein FIBSPDRAFT_965987 [Fibularhizoctonia sp. CBS 109695]
MPPLVYSNAHTTDPYIIRLLRAISAHQPLELPTPSASRPSPLSPSPPSETVSAPTLPPALAGAPLKRIISISDSDSDDDDEHEIARLSSLLHKTRFFVIPDDAADDSEYQEYLAEMTVLRAARKKLRKKVKHGKLKVGVGSYTDPEMEAFMAGLPLNEKSEILVPHTLILQSSKPDSSTYVPGPPTSVHGPPTSVPRPSTFIPGPPTSVPGPSTSVPGPSTSVPGPATSVPGPATSVLSPATSVPGPSTSIRRYNVTSPSRTGLIETWALAGHLTQGVPGGHVKRSDRALTQQKVYVVFQGLQVGIFEPWNDTEPHVTAINGSTYEAYSSRLCAERAWVLGHALGAVRQLDRTDTALAVPAAAYPSKVVLSFLELEDDYLGTPWQVVSQGRRPGIYPCWNIAASQVQWVSAAVWSKYPSKLAAVIAFERAKRERAVRTLN